MSEISLALTTRLREPKKFTVDGEEYQLLGIDHLTPEQENKVMALFSRHGILLGQAEATEHLGKGEAIAGKVRQTRLQIISALTDLPRDVAGKLPITQQAKLLEALQAEVNASDDEEPSDDSDDDGNAN